MTTQAPGGAPGGLSPDLARRQAAAQLRLRDCPPLVLVYGDSKTGKSSDALFTLPQALFIGPRGSFKPATSVVGWAPLDVVDVSELDEIFKVVKEKITPKGQFQGLVVDDVSTAAKNNKIKHERSGKDGWALWGAVGTSLSNIIAYCRDQAGVPVFLISHARGPDRNKAGQITCKGCPDMPTESLSLEFPRHCDVAVRTDIEPSRTFGFPHSGIYRGGASHPEWITGDRNNVVRDWAPMNMAEILRSAGYTLPRAPGMDWLESYVQGVAQEILGGKPEQAVVQPWVARFREQSIPGWVIGWFVRDVRDRVWLARHTYDPVAAYGY